MSKTDNNDASITLQNKILDCYNVSCPIRTKIFSFEDQTKLRINATNKHNILKRQNNNCLHRMNLISEREFKPFWNHLNNRTRFAKRQYYKKLFWCKRKFFLTWITVKSVLQEHSGNNKSEIKSTIVNNVLYTDNYAIFQQFNYYFSTKGNKVQETISNTFANG